MKLINPSRLITRTLNAVRQYVMGQARELQIQLNFNILLL